MRIYLNRSSVFVFLLVTCCGGSFLSQEYEYLPQVKKVDAIVLLHPSFYFRGMKSHQVYERWMTLADDLARNTGALIIGPDEYRTMTTGMLTDLAHETDVPVTLKRYGISAENAVAIRLTLTESWQEVERTVSGKGKSYKGRGEFRSDVEFVADVYHLATSKPLLTAKNSFSGVLRGDARPGDAHPGMTRFAAESYHYLTVRLASHFEFPALPPTVDVRGLANPLEVENYRHEKLPSFGEELARKDEMDRDAMRVNRILFRYPEILRGQRRLLQKGLHGILVQRAARCTGLKEGDFVVAADAAKVTREYHLNGIRLLLAAGRQVTFEVLRGKNREKVTTRCGRQASLARRGFAGPTDFSGPGYSSSSVERLGSWTRSMRSN